MSDKNRPPVEVGNAVILKVPMLIAQKVIPVLKTSGRNREYYCLYMLDRNSECVPNHLLTLQTFQRKSFDYDQPHLLGRLDLVKDS